MAGLLPWLILLLVFTAGYAVQRGSVCAVAAAEELIDERRIERFLAFFVSAALALVVMAGAALAGIEMLDHYRATAALAGPLAGGALFGIGAWINGRCAFGIIARLGSGDLSRIGSVAGMFAGFLIAARLGVDGGAALFPSVLTGASDALVLAGALILTLGTGVLLYRRPGMRSVGNGWSPLTSMAVIGLVNGVLLMVAAGWPYTSLLMDLARAPGMGLAWRGLLAAIFVAGALAAALANGTFQSNPGSPRHWLRHVGGGMLMGIGATLVPGGNDTMLLVGLPLLLPNLVLAYAAMMVVLCILVAARRRRSARAGGVAVNLPR